MGWRLHRQQQHDICDDISNSENYPIPKRWKEITFLGVPLIHNLYRTSDNEYVVESKDVDDKINNRIDFP